MDKCFNIQYAPSVIQKKRREVRAQILSDSPYLKEGILDRISNNDLHLLVRCYDQVFLKGWLQAHLAVPLRLTLSGRLSKAAGKTLARYKQRSKEILDLEIRIGTGFLFQHHLLQREKTVGGLPARDGLEALMLVMEHELCHVLEFGLYGASNCRRERFQDLALGLFGHTASHHQLLTDSEIARESHAFQPGDLVLFDYEHKRVQGVIQRIHKRATVMVLDRDGDYQDAQGKRYTKYYVPLPNLKRN